MKNSNHKNSGCLYGEQLVSYLYDETGSAESSSFEKHLENCSACAEELTAFSGIKFSIGNWKLNDFAALETPVIEIPYEKPRKESEIGAVQETWLARLRDLFSLSPAWSLAAASVAVLAICTGAVLIKVNSGRGDDVAGTNKNTQQVATPTFERSPKAVNADVNSNESAETDAAPRKEPKPTLPERADNEPAVKASKNQRQLPKAAADLPKPSNAKRDHKNKTVVPPKTLVEEDEDDSLRLAELFEEIDTIE
jgi:anti-sigma factor RsiW